MNRGVLVRAVVGVLVALSVAGCAGVQQASPTVSAAPTATTLALPSATSAMTASPSPLPSPTRVPSSTPLAAPTATATPVSGDVVLARFASRFGEEQPDFHIVCTVDADFSVENETVQLSITLEGDISGQDFAGVMAMQTPGVTFELDMVVVGDEVYVRPARGEWTSGEEFEQTQPLNPFSAEYTGSFEYRGSVVREGRRLHNLYLDEWIGGDVNRQLRQAGMRKAKLESSEFDVYVGDDGLPVLATLDFSISGKLSGEQVVFVYYVTYEFSDIGVPVTISAPT